MNLFNSSTTHDTLFLLGFAANQTRVTALREDVEAVEPPAPVLDFCRRRTWSRLNGEVRLAEAFPLDSHASLKREARALLWYTLPACRGSCGCPPHERGSRPAPEARA